MTDAPADAPAADDSLSPFRNFINSLDEDDDKPRGELWELFEVKSFEEFKDELSDISWGFGRILGGFLKKPYVRIPGDGIHFDKVASRVEEYGCIRSPRFLVDGQCPSGGQS